MTSEDLKTSNLDYLNDFQHHYGRRYPAKHKIALKFGQKIEGAYRSLLRSMRVCFGPFYGTVPFIG